VRLRRVDDSAWPRGSGGAVASAGDAGAHGAGRMGGDVDVLEGKVAVVTGAASGIGCALSAAWAAEGMRVVMADIEAPALAEAAAALRATGAEVLEVVTDVRDPAQVEALAERAVATYGGVHVACNNAGVGRSGLAMWDEPLAAWEWTLGVNLWGVINGVRAFVPRMIAQGEGHIVNTASLAGLSASGILGPYTVSKYAVVGLSEELFLNLHLLGAPVGVSVLCPGPVNTRIVTAERNGPAELRDTPLVPGAAMIHDALVQMLRQGLEPGEVAATVVAAVKAGRFYVVADANEDWRQAVRGRADNIEALRNPTASARTDAAALLDATAPPE
jgi:NAD(P)-dependent dehydrogenase (short-subunit alcohol dehydrogenase family)